MDVVAECGVNDVVVVFIQNLFKQSVYAFDALIGLYCFY